MSVMSLKNRISDVLKWEVSPLFCRDKMTVTVAEEGTAVDLQAGDIYQKSTATKLGDTAENVSDMDCIVLEPGKVAAGESKDFLVLVRGPALYDLDNLNVSESKKSDLIAQLATLNLQPVQQAANTVYQEI